MSDCPPAPTSSAGNTLLPAGASCPVALFLLLHVKQGLRPTLFASEDVTLSLKACMTYSLLGSSCWWSCAPPSRQLQLRLTLCPVSLELQCVSLSFSSFFPLFFFSQKRREEMSFSPCPSTCEVSRAPVSSKMLLTGLEWSGSRCLQVTEPFLPGAFRGLLVQMFSVPPAGLHVLTTPDSLSPRRDCLMSHVFRSGKFSCYVLVVTHPSFFL